MHFNLQQLIIFYPGKNYPIVFIKPSKPAVILRRHHPADFFFINKTIVTITKCVMVLLVIIGLVLVLLNGPCGSLLVIGLLLFVAC